MRKPSGARASVGTGNLRTVLAVAMVAVLAANASGQAPPAQQPLPDYFEPIETPDAPPEGQDPQASAEQVRRSGRGTRYVPGYGWVAGPELPTTPASPKPSRQPPVVIVTGGESWWLAFVKGFGKVVLMAMIAGAVVAGIKAVWRQQKRTRQARYDARRRISSAKMTAYPASKREGIRKLEAGQAMTLEIRNPEGDHFTILELSKEQRKRAARRSGDRRKKKSDRRGEASKQEAQIRELREENRRLKTENAELRRRLEKVEAGGK